MQILYIILFILVILLIYSYYQNDKLNIKEYFNIAYPYYINPYYFPSNCIETLFDEIKCFPLFNFYNPYYF